MIFLVFEVVKLILDDTVPIRWIGDFGLSWMDHVFLPLEDVQRYLPAVAPFTPLEEVKEEDYLKIVEV